jgi:hypothetical protein
MPDKVFGPRKRRTRQHVIADQSVHHVEGFILEAGHTAERFYRDYGYDLQITTYDRRGFVETGHVYFQIKASENLHKTRRGFAFDLDIRDYNLWLREPTMVILVLYDAVHKRAYWLNVHDYFASEQGAPAPGAKWIRVYFPGSDLMTTKTILDLRLSKNRGSL